MLTDEKNAALISENDSQQLIHTQQKAQENRELKLKEVMGELGMTYTHTYGQTCTYGYAHTYG